MHNWCVEIAPGDIFSDDYTLTTGYGYDYWLV